MTNFDININIYDDAFYEFVSRTAMQSAKEIIPVINSMIGKPESVLDVGCGRGAWLFEWKNLGVEDIYGIDGDSAPNGLLIASDKYKSHNLNEPFSLNRRFDIVQCLEVAEHLAPHSGEGLISTLCQHGDIILFSAAIPGQGGEGHINERPYDYWRDLFVKKDYFLIDFIRPMIVKNENITWWYRYNIFLYVNQKVIKRFPNLMSYYVPSESMIINYFPLFDRRLIRLILKIFPTPIILFLAKLTSNLPFRKAKA